MKKTKYLIVGGCSFTAYKGCWPTWLKKYLKNYRLQNTAVGASDNTLIARKIIYNVNSFLENNYNPENIIVGIMWSGYDRKSFYSDDKFQMQKMYGMDIKGLKTISRTRNKNISVNPHFEPHDRKGVYLLSNANMITDYPYAKNYYKQYHNRTYSRIETYEQILRVQWFLKSHNIKYFMVPYTDNWLTHDKKHSQLDYFTKMIDTDYWLPVSSEKGWIDKNSKFSNTEYDPIRKIAREPDDHHPSSYQHKEFVDQVVVPWLNSREWITE